jgi:glyoxylase-like metal-dependent hydrolase (beta-lactamase superfamily II)
MMNEPIKNKRLPEMNSTWHVLQVGSGSPGVRSSVSLIVDGDQLIVVDPGMAPSQSAISGPLRDLGFGAGQITDVVISHHHPDHTINVGMFPNARVHDHWAVYHYENGIAGQLRASSYLPRCCSGKPPATLLRTSPPSPGPTGAWSHLPTCGFAAPDQQMIRTAPIQPGSIEAGRGCWKWPA